jgi:flavin-dependent dehydrogenase
MGGPRAAARGQLARLCSAYGFDPDLLANVRGHRLPFRRRRSPLAAGRVALIGDAAGLVDPLFGDGMYEAALSAKLAARQALRILSGDANSFGGYACELRETLAPLLRISWPAKYPFDLLPALSFNLANTPQFWTLVTRMMLGEVAAVPLDA